MKLLEVPDTSNERYLDLLADKRTGDQRVSLDEWSAPYTATLINRTGKRLVAGFKPQFVEGGATVGTELQLSVRNLPWQTVQPGDFKRINLTPYEQCRVAVRFRATLPGTYSPRMAELQPVGYWH